MLPKTQSAYCFLILKLLQSQVKHGADGGKQIPGQDHQNRRFLHRQASLQDETAYHQIASVIQQTVNGAEDDPFNGAHLLRPFAGIDNGPVQLPVAFHEPALHTVGFDVFNAVIALQHPRAVIFLVRVGLIVDLPGPLLINYDGKELGQVHQKEDILVKLLIYLQY